MALSRWSYSDPFATSGYTDPFALARRDVDRIFGDFMRPDFPGLAMEPRSLIQDLWNRVGGVMEPGYRGGERLGTAGGDIIPWTAGISEWTPRADLRETDKEYSIHCELPGVSKENIRVDVDGSTLSIRGELKREEEKEEGQIIRRERRQGNFFRSFRLPGLRRTDPKEIQANFNQGVLEIRVPKKPAEQAQQVMIAGPEQTQAKIQATPSQTQQQQQTIRT